MKYVKKITITFYKENNSILDKLKSLGNIFITITL